MTDPSEWKAIPGFDGAYDLNAAGDVRSWKVWRGSKDALPRAMKVQVRADKSRWIQLGLHGGTWNVDALVAVLFPDFAQSAWAARASALAREMESIGEGFHMGDAAVTRARQIFEGDEDG